MHYQRQLLTMLMTTISEVKTKQYALTKADL